MKIFFKLFAALALFFSIAACSEGNNGLDPMHSDIGNNHKVTTAVATPLLYADGSVTQTGVVRVNNEGCLGHTVTNATTMVDFKSNGAHGFEAATTNTVAGNNSCVAAIGAMGTVAAALVTDGIANTVVSTSAAEANSNSSAIAGQGGKK